MHHRTLLLLLAVALTLWQPHLPTAAADPATAQVTLYAHTDPSAVSANGRVLSLVANTTLRQAADVRDGLAFTLVPALSAPLRIQGGVVAYVWLLCQARVRGTLRVSISEVTANGSATEIRSASATPGQDLPTTPYSFIMGFQPANYTLASGSVLRFEVKFSPEKAVPVSLLWDNPSTPTRLVMQVESSPNVNLAVRDISGRSSTIFAQNETGVASLIVEALVEEPFGGVNIGIVSLTVANSSGYLLVNDVPMNLTSRVERPFRVHYALPIAVPAGRFNVTVSVRDLAKRTFLTVREITVTQFHTLTLLLVDAQERALPGLNVSFSAEGQSLDEITTSTDGTAALLLPSSEAVGPITLRVRRDTLVILSREVDVESDAMLQLELPVYDWTFNVRVQTLNVPVSGASVELYLNGTLLASNVTDSRGLAAFNAMPLGEYDVSVTSSLGFKRFVNVTHSSNLRETTLDLPVLPQIPENALLLLAGIALLAVLGVVAATTRKAGGRRFKHFADLLGGTLPRSAVTMIVGPPGSGKSLLLRNILADSLRLGRHCVYVSNSEMPSKIREQLTKMGLDAEKYQDRNLIRFVDAYSGGTGLVSSEKHYVSSPRDLTALGIQLTVCFEELGGVGDVFLDSLGPIVALGDPAQALKFVHYYGARITKSGGSFLYVATETIDSELLSRLEEASDCVLRTERHVGSRRVWGRLLVKKARGVEHEEDWVGFKITATGRMEFVSLPSEKQ